MAALTWQKTMNIYLVIKPWEGFYRYNPNCQLSTSLKLVTTECRLSASSQHRWKLFWVVYYTACGCRAYMIFQTIGAMCNSNEVRPFWFHFEYKACRLCLVCYITVRNGVRVWCAPHDSWRQNLWLIRITSFCLWRTQTNSRSHYQPCAEHLHYACRSEQTESRRTRWSYSWAASER